MLPLKNAVFWTLAVSVEMVVVGKQDQREIIIIIILDF